VSYEKIGDVLVAQGNLPDALKSYRDGLAIMDLLAKADPGNAGWQRDLSVSYENIGDVLVTQGNLPDTLKSYRDRLAIMDLLAKAPGNAGCVACPICAKIANSVLIVKSAFPIRGPPAYDLCAKTLVSLRLHRGSACRSTSVTRPSTSFQKSSRPADR
jgi:hypothetical protein